MARPRKYPPAPPADDLDNDDRPEEHEPVLEELDDGQLVTLALDRPLMKLTPAMVRALNLAWREYVLADDDEAKMLCRRIKSRLGRASHGELYPGCVMVKLNVPVLKRQDGRGGFWYVKINERVYAGDVEVTECTARQIVELVHRYQQVEANRMTEGQEHLIDLDGGLAERARAIQRA